MSSWFPRLPSRFGRRDIPFARAQIACFIGNAQEGIDAIESSVMNPDQALLARFSGAPLSVDSNALAAALRTTLVALDRSKGSVTLTFEPGDQFVQGRGVVQGGIVATMLDFAAAFAALAVLPEGQSAATASLTVGFQAAVRAGTVIATGTVERAGKRAVFTRAQISDGGGQVLATATAVMLVLPERPA